MPKQLTSEQVAKAQHLLAVLKDTFPTVFVSDTAAIRPLKLDIHRDIHLQLTGRYSKKEIIRALYLYTKEKAYTDKLVVGTPRFDLTGQIDGEVTEAHVQIAKEAALRAQCRKEKQPENSALSCATSTSGATPASPETAYVTTIGKRPVLGLKKERNSLFHSTVIQHTASGQKRIPDMPTSVRRTAFGIKRHTTTQPIHAQPASTRKVARLNGRDVQTPISGKLEINIKIHALPCEVQTVKNGWQEFVVEADGQLVSMRVRPRTWHKLQYAAENYDDWVASITGKMGRRIKNGFELSHPSVQIFEKKSSVSDMAVLSDNTLNQEASSL